MEQSLPQELVQQVGGSFRLTTLLQKRVRELVRGQKPLFETRERNFIKIASEELRRGLSQNDMVGQRAQNGFFYQRASDLVIVPEPYWLFEKSGTSHGTPWNYDAHVPVIFMGPGIKAGKYNGRACVNDIAPTLTNMLEVETPSGSAGRVLTEMLVK